jgi:3-hydroxybutyrate dehydrogenase
MASRFELTGKRALITGAARGIGHAVAKAYLQAGAECIMLDAAPGIADAAAKLGAEHGGKATPIQADVTDEKAVAAAMRGVRSLDVLVNNAGVGYATPIDDPSPDAVEKFRRTQEINLIGVYLMTRAALPLMGRGARIINVASAWGKAAGKTFSAYVASKHAVIGFTRTLAMELGPRGIAVNAVCPGTTATEMNNENMPKAMQEQLFAQMQIDPGWIQPDDLAQTFVFLASDAASIITGQAISADRGQVMI